jgi:hypothetical protein
LEQKILLAIGQSRVTDGFQRTRFLARVAGMTDQQFQLILRHLQVIIAILGVMAGVLIALALTYL